MSYEDNKKQGWVKVYRSLLSDPIIFDLPATHFKIFVVMLLMANRESNDWTYRGHSYHCEPGQLWTSAEQLAKRCGKGISARIVRRALGSMQRAGVVTKQGSYLGTLITIVNWELYQGQLDEGGKPKGKVKGKGKVKPKSKKRSTNKKDIYIQEIEKEYKEKESASIVSNENEVQDEEGTMSSEEWWAYLEAQEKKEKEAEAKKKVGGKG